jgi:SagB-type dehydrogenase family enzyme
MARTTGEDLNLEASTGDQDIWELIGPPRLDTISELYHENSKIQPSATAFAISPEVLHVMSAGYKRYELADVVELPDAREKLTMPLGEAIRERRTIREFTGEHLPVEALGALLMHGFGESENFRRPTPSAGALYPLEAYAVVLRGHSTVPRGVYHYNVSDHLLERVPSAGPVERLNHAIFVPDLVETAGVIVIVTAVFGRSRIKYGERGYRFILLEAGHVVQNLCLAAVALGVGACPIGGFVDDSVSEVLDVDGVDEAPIYLIAFGSLT